MPEVQQPECNDWHSNLLHLYGAYIGYTFFQHNSPIASLWYPFLACKQQLFRLSEPKHWYVQMQTPQ